MHFDGTYISAETFIEFVKLSTWTISATCQLYIAEKQTEYGVSSFWIYKREIEEELRQYWPTKINKQQWYKFSHRGWKNHFDETGLALLFTPVGQHASTHWIPFHDFAQGAEAINETTETVSLSIAINNLQVLQNDAAIDEFTKVRDTYLNKIAVKNLAKKEALRGEKTTIWGRSTSTSLSKPQPDRQTDHRKRQCRKRKAV